MLITRAKVVTGQNPNAILENCAILIEQGMIREIGASKELSEKYPSEEVLDANGQYVMPGNICAHTHFYGAFSRGMGIPGDAPDAFPAILQKLWWPLDQALDMEDVRYSALVCLVNAVRHGTTTLIDHHASPNAIDGSLDVIAEAAQTAGVRTSLCYEVTDRGGEARALAGIRENVRFIKKAQTEYAAGGMLAATFGLHASLTLGDATLEKCKQEIPANAGFHIHVAEHISDQYDSLAKSGMRVVDRMAKFGILGPRSIIVHAVNTDAREISLLAESKSWVSHQPRSNMNNAVGMSEVEAMLRAGIRVCLGNDGFSNAMWEEWKAAYLAHKLWHRDPRRMGGYTVQEMAITNNAALATQMFGRKVGTIEAGAAADLIFVDYHPFTEFTAGNLPWHIIFGFHESMITTTIVDGIVLMKDRRLLALDEEEIAARARELSAKTWKRYQAQFNER